MDSLRIESLLTKYWAGESTPQEEELIRGAIQDGSYIPDPDAEMSYFSWLNQLQAQELGTDFEREILQKITGRKQKELFLYIRRIAAAVLILLSATFYLFIKPSQKQADLAKMMEAREAFELTKQALFLVSTELNRGASFTQELDQFDRIFEKIKTDEIKNTN